MSEVFSLLGMASIPLAVLVVVLIDVLYPPTIEASVHVIPIHRPPAQPVKAYPDAPSP